ncbi:hypothetical protein VTJ04DRAFT_9792 [Mycothermus thermophilus]|uniref:uncharacterized protein n=1 Tax=Humicola insolens TaxID=85995 RepID=UPI00374425C8
MPGSAPTPAWNLSWSGPVNSLRSMNTNALNAYNTVPTISQFLPISLCVPSIPQNSKVNVLKPMYLLTDN